VDEVVNSNSPEPYASVVETKDVSELDSKVINLERKDRAGRMAGGVIEMKLIMIDADQPSALQTRHARTSKATYGITTRQA
jgi:hypothetical protein